MTNTVADERSPQGDTEPTEGDDVAAPGGADSSGPWRVARGLSLLPYGPNEVFVRHGSRSKMSKVVRDPGRKMILWPTLLTIIEKAKTTEDIVRELSAPDTGASDHEVDEDSVSRLLGDLAESGVVEVEREVKPLRATVLADGRIGQQLVELLDGVEPRLVPSADLDVDDLDEMLAEVAEHADLLVLANDRLRPALDLTINELAMPLGLPVLRLTLDGDECLIGPLVVPGETGCLSCLDVQDEASRQFRHDFISYKQNASESGLLMSSPPSAMTKIGASIVAGIGAAAINDAAVRPWGFLADRVVRIDLGRWDITTDRVIALPRCPACMRARVDPRHTFL